MGAKGRMTSMKRLLSIALAFSLLGSTVAMARGYHGDYRSYNSYSYRGDEHRDRGGNAAAAIGVGILALGLFGALASQNDHYSSGYYAAPSPAYAYPGYGYAAPGYGYASPDYGYGYGYYGR
jgi:hypothetical protein